MGGFVRSLGRIPTPSGSHLHEWRNGGDFGRYLKVLGNCRMLDDMLNYWHHNHGLSDGCRIAASECRDPRARVEGILLADPALAALWRMETSLLEAAASVGLEGERISTQGMVLRLTSGTAMDEDARAVEMALKVLTVIRRPGDPFGAPVAALRRIEAAAAPIGQTRDEGDRLEDAELPLVVEAGRAWSHVPILGGMALRRPAMPSAPGAAARWPSG